MQGRTLRVLRRYGLASDEDESNYADGAECGSESTDPDQDDEEHVNGMEQQGVLYHPLEPPILLACKEVRKQATSIYPNTNAFLWRFYWLG